MLRLASRLPDLVAQVDGRPTVPSVVSYPEDGGQPLVGVSAAARRALEPGRTVFGAKRLIGRPFDHPDVAAEAAHLPYAVVRSTFGDDSVELELRGGTGADGALRPPLRLSPVAVSAAVLRRLKEAAEASRPLAFLLGARFRSATISVPVAFSTRQRQATLAAAKRAGFGLVRLIEEPVAAAVAYGLAASGERTVLVYDLGGGTLDCALLRLEAATRTFLVLATSGDPRLGGEDFDRSLAEWATREAGEKAARGGGGGVAAGGGGAQGDREISAAERGGGDSGGDGDIATARLLSAVEDAKRRLGDSAAGVALTLPPPAASTSSSTSSTAPPPPRTTLLLTQSVVDTSCAHLLSRALAPLADVLASAGLSVADVDDVVLVGGGTRLEAVRRAVRGAMGGASRLHTELDPDTAIAVGAARAYNC